MNFYYYWWPYRGYQAIKGRVARSVCFDPWFSLVNSCDLVSEVGTWFTSSALQIHVCNLYWKDFEKEIFGLVNKYMDRSRVPGCGSNNNSRQVIPSIRWFHIIGSSQQIPNRHIAQSVQHTQAATFQSSPWSMYDPTIANVAANSVRDEVQKGDITTSNNTNQLFLVMNAGPLVSTSLNCYVFRRRKVVWCQFRWIWVSVSFNEDELWSGVSSIDWNCNVSTTLSIVNKISECHKALLSYFLHTSISSWLLHYAVLIHPYILMPYEWLRARLQYLQCVSNGETIVLHNHTKPSV